MQVLPKILLTGAALLALAQIPAQAFCGFFAGKADANLMNLSNH